MLDIDKLAEDLTRDEGCVLKPYLCTAGKLTIGVGRNLDDVGITAGEAAQLLENDMKSVVRELDAALPWWREMDEPRQRVLANMCFNLGLSRLLKFRKALAAMKAGDYDTAAKEMLDSRWAVQVKGRAKRLARIMRKGSNG